MTMLLGTAARELRIACRRLIKTPAFLFLSVGTLALAIGLTTAAYSALFLVIGRDSGFRSDDRMVVIAPRRAVNPRAVPGFSWRDLHAVTSAALGLETHAAWTRFSAALRAPGGNSLVVAEAVSGDYFSILGIDSVKGRLLTRADDQPGAAPVAVLSHTVWRRHFESRDVLGDTLILAGHPVTIVGVAPAGFMGAGPSSPLTRMVWVPLSWWRLLANTSQATTEPTLHLLGVLPHGREAESSAAAAAAVAVQLDEIDPRPALRLGGGAERERPRREWVVTPLMSRTSRPTPFLIALFALPVLVLLVACTNLANLVLSRGVSRADETAVNFALGASRWRIVRQHLWESVVLAILGGLGGLLVAVGFIKSLIAAINEPLAALAPLLSVAWALEGRVFAASAFSAVVAILVGGLVPAYVLSYAEPSRLLASHAGATTLPRWRGRSNLIALQVSVSVALLLLAVLATELINRSSRRELAASGAVQDLSRAAVAHLPLADQRVGGMAAVAVANAVVREAQTIPGVAAAIVGTHLPVPLAWSPTPHSAVSIGPSADGATRGAAARLLATTPESLYQLKFELVAGRLFTESDAGQQAPPIILEERLAGRVFGSTAVLGRQVFWRHDRILSEADIVRSGNVIGIVRLVHPTPVDNDADLLFTTLEHTFVPAVTILVLSKVNDGQTLVRPLQDAIRRVDPGLAVAASGSAMSMVHAGILFRGILAGAAAVLALTALVLAMTGLNGVLSQLLKLRSREIGLRLALGAGKAEIVRMLVRDGMRPVLEGLFLGVVGAFVLKQTAQWFTSESLPPLDFLTLIAATSPILIVAAVTCWIPARRASRIDLRSVLANL